MVTLPLASAYNADFEKTGRQTRRETDNKANPLMNVGAVSTFVFRTGRKPATSPRPEDPSHFRTATRTMSQEAVRFDSAATSLATCFRGPRLETFKPDTSTVIAPQRSWKNWVSEKITSGKNGNEVTPVKTDVINIFPGWAARRYSEGEESEVSRPFEVEAFVNGFAISHRAPQNATRSQRAFIRLAKGFVSLPKVEELNDMSGNISPRSPALTSFGEESPREVDLPLYLIDTRIGGQMEALEREYQRVKDNSDSETLPQSSPIEVSPPHTPKSVNRTRYCSIPTETLRRFHANVESRLQPFWSPVLSNRTIRLYLFASPPDHPIAQICTGLHGYPVGPLATKDVVTGTSGSFQAHFRVKWEDLHQHFRAHKNALKDCAEPNLTIVAKLLPLPGTSASQQEKPSFEPLTQASSTIQIPITHCPVRVISDIDDTIKLSNITSGARTVFHNVFVKDLHDCVIPGMKEWYGSLFNQGIRFHYVSNAPYELLPVIKEFLQISQLPPGSIKIKSYSGRSLFTGLLSRPAARKRAGITDIMDAFPGSKFLLIGDSGEQDLELYAEISRERPDRVLGVFIRDVNAGYAMDDPAGLNMMTSGETRSQFTSTILRRDFSHMKRSLSDQLVSFLSSRRKKLPASPLDVAEHNDSSYFKSPVCAEPEQLKSEEEHDGDLCSTPIPRAVRVAPSRILSKSSFTSKPPSLQTRVYWARSRIPGHIPLKVFREPGECVRVVNEVLVKKNKGDAVGGGVQVQ